MTFWDVFWLVLLIGGITPLVVYFSVKLGTLARFRALFYIKRFQHQERENDYGEDET